MSIGDDTKLDDMKLSTRLYNRLRSAGISRIGHLRYRTAEQILKLHGVGRISLGELEDELARLGTSLKPSPERMISLLRARLGAVAAELEEHLRHCNVERDTLKHLVKATRAGLLGGDLA